MIPPGHQGEEEAGKIAMNGEGRRRREEAGKDSGTQETKAKMKSVHWTAGS